MGGKGGISGVAIVTLAGGSILLWSGIKGRSWSAVLRELISGNQPSTATQENPITVTPASGGVNPGLTGPIQQTPAGVTKGANAITNKATVRMLAATYGWGTGSNWNSLDNIISHESSWSNTADNPSSHAYGLFQALPYTKMPKAAWPPSAGGSSDPVVQTKWGLAYIKQRYHTPDQAWAWWQTHNWY